MPGPLYTLEVTLTGGYTTDEFAAGNPVVSRTIEIQAHQTLNQLHRAIFEAFGRWDDCHLHEFNFGNGVLDQAGDRYVLPFIYEEPEHYGEERQATGSVTKTRIGALDLKVGQVFWYWYDFGDDWQHRIDVIAIGEADARMKYPRETARVGESPPQYPPVEEDEWEDQGEGPGIPAKNIETGETEMVDGQEIRWVRGELSEAHTSELRDASAARSYRVVTLRKGLDGEDWVTHYEVPGIWLDVWLGELHGRGDEAEIVLSVEPFSP